MRCAQRFHPIVVAKRQCLCRHAASTHEATASSKRVSRYRRPASGEQPRHSCLSAAISRVPLRAVSGKVQASQDTKQPPKPSRLAPSMGCLCDFYNEHATANNDRGSGRPPQPPEHVIMFPHGPTNKTVSALDWSRLWSGGCDGLPDPRTAMCC
jgi:hypothetical protein